MVTWIGFAFLLGIALAFTDREKALLFENCTLYNDSNLYGGLICGSDDLTYANTLYLDCANYLHPQNPVSMIHKGPCITEADYCNLNPLYEPVCGSDNSTYANEQTLGCHNYKYNKNVTVQFTGPCEALDSCFRNGYEEFGINPVCASNGLTYGNAGQVKCLQSLGSPLKILHDGGCTVQYVYKMYGNKEKACEIATTRYEWNPVCASDGATYPNPFILLCFHPELNVVYNGECDTSTELACVKAHTNDVVKDGIVSNKDFTPEDAVCGTDGRTYISKYHIQCNSRYNKYLYLKHVGACVEDDSCDFEPETGPGSPVCGSDGVSYISPEALWCVKRRSKPHLVYAHDGPC